ncbi:hypothetical protein [Desulfogranum marinum]|uniref:hypothetical protein n=1 Tax=Desulfogranum marinum TaxID=453220 RepID=UPI0029C83595|nr:hypothetical protein [Desulfogranum marinum]
MQRLDDRSRMSGDAHVRFCESLRGKFPRATRLVICFEREEDAHALLKALTERFVRYKLTLNREKTHLVRFGRQSGGPGGRKSETFDFLGFTHIAGKDRSGRYLAQRKTSRKSFRRSIKAIYEWCKVNRHQPLSLQYKELSLKLSGHYEYYGIRGNYDALSRFRQRVWKLWRLALMRRSQKVNHKRLYTLTVETFKLPLPRITHSEGWLRVNPGYLLGRAGCGNAARPVL